MTDDDPLTSYTHAIELICGCFPFGMNIDQASKLRKIFLQGATAQHGCPIFLLGAITELCSELIKTAGGRDAAIKILGRRNCIVGQNDEHLSCLDGLAKLIKVFQETK